MKPTKHERIKRIPTKSNLLKLNEIIFMVMKMDLKSCLKSLKDISKKKILL